MKFVLIVLFMLAAVPISAVLCLWWVWMYYLVVGILDLQSPLTLKQVYLLSWLVSYNLAFMVRKSHFHEIIDNTVKEYT